MTREVRQVAVLSAILCIEPYESAERIFNVLRTVQMGYNYCESMVLSRKRCYNCTSFPFVIRPRSLDSAGGPSRSKYKASKLLSMARGSTKGRISDALIVYKMVWR